VRLRKRIKFSKLLLILLLPFIVSCNIETSESKRAPYIEHVHEIIRVFAAEMKEKYGLRCCGSGGSMPYNVEKISVIFTILKKVTLEEARIIEVNAVEKLIDLVNGYEKIRPYLAEYPFNSSRIKISISFNDKSGLHHTDGNITYVSLIKNKIFFDRAEKTTSKTLYGKTYDDFNLITLLEESYEEALEKVKSANSFINSNTFFDDSNLEEEKPIEEKE